ncbi:hypothetical protein [Cellulomonas sp. S1-8]|uniref:hypothetical protein n=1 Tax=Cellulomonas sp. S1-8 TaxID=2904790 RepID=UPI0022432146|nr:hypothetical protein [Cellulomonas sp. S1-8]UZN02168.1 hypothetical protein OKX07_13865 [Cellulomonas sp. S1-8]
MPVRPLRPGPLAAALVVLVAGGCAGTPADPPPTSAAPIESPTESATPAPVVPASVQCLESGVWVVDAAREATLFAEGLSMHAADVSAEYTGEAVYTFADGVLTRTYTGWQEYFSAILDAPGSPLVTETATQEGSTTAAYEATETDVVTQAADVTGLTVTVAGTRDGAPVTFDDPGANRVTAETEAQTWAFTCEGDTLRLSERDEAGQPGGEYATTVLQRR